MAFQTTSPHIRPQRVHIRWLHAGFVPHASLAESNGYASLRLQVVPDYPHDHAWHLFVIVLDPERAGMDRAAFMAAMKERNIGTGLHYQAAHLFTYYRELLGTGPGSFPHAEDAGANIVSLPLFPAMTEAEQDRVVEAMDDIFARGAQ